jgi:glycosyltransferase involved in cell wall biosynthesis
MIKIAMILPSLAQKGPIIVAKDIIDNLYKKIYFEVFYFDDIVELDFPCKVTRIDNKYRIEDFDIIHSHGYRPDKFSNKINNLIKVSTVHNYMKEDLKNIVGGVFSMLFERYWCRILNKKDIVVCLSNQMMQYYSSSIINYKLKYIYNGRPKIEKKYENNSIINEILDFKGDALLIGVFCVLTYRKGIDRIIKFLSLNKKVKLLVVGDGKEKNNLMNIAIKYKVENRIFWAGFNNTPEIFYDIIDLNIMASRSEGFPLSLLEMGMNKIPTACVKMDLFCELYSEYELSYFEPDNPQSMYDACEKLLLYKDKFRENFYNKTISEYSHINMANKYFNLYQELFKSK